MSGSLTIVVTEPVDYTPAGVWELIVYSNDVAQSFLPIGQYGVATIFTTSAGLNIRFDGWAWNSASTTRAQWVVYDDDMFYEKYDVLSCAGEKTGQFESTWVISTPDEIEALFDDIVRVSYVKVLYAWWGSAIPNWRELETFTLTTNGWVPLRTAGAVVPSRGIELGIAPDYTYGSARYAVPQVEYQMTVHVPLATDIQLRVYRPSGGLLFDSEQLSWQEDTERTDAVFAQLGAPTPDIFWTQRILCEETQS